MDQKSPIQSVVEQLTKLPGIGMKSAERLAFHFLSLPKQDVKQLAEVLVVTRETIKYCRECFNISFQEICYICQDSLRDNTKLCIVSDPKDIVAIEKTRAYKGKYHVLGGVISPIDGIHPETLRIKELLDRLNKKNIEEIIFAINPTIEGDATVLYLTQLLTGSQIKLTKLAHGLPMGADIDYADELTLQKALSGRTIINRE